MKNNALSKLAANIGLRVQCLVGPIRYLYQYSRAEYWKWRLKQRLRKRGFDWLDAALKRQGYSREDLPDGTTIYRLGDTTWTVTLDA